MSVRVNNLELLTSLWPEKAWHDQLASVQRVFVHKKSPRG
jgi:hypothetical protein